MFLDYIHDLGFRVASRVIPQVFFMRRSCMFLDYIHDLGFRVASLEFRMQDLGYTVKRFRTCTYHEVSSIHKEPSKYLHIHTPNPEQNPTAHRVLETCIVFEYSHAMS